MKRICSINSIFTLSSTPTTEVVLFKSNIALPSQASSNWNYHISYFSVILINLLILRTLPHTGNYWNCILPSPCSVQVSMRERSQLRISGFKSPALWFLCSPRPLPPPLSLNLALLSKVEIQCRWESSIPLLPPGTMWAHHHSIPTGTNIAASPTNNVCKKRRVYIKEHHIISQRSREKRKRKNALITNSLGLGHHFLSAPISLMITYFAL